MELLPITPALSETYSDIIVQKSLYPLSSVQSPRFFPAELPMQPISDQYAILYAPLSQHLSTVEEIGYASVPKLFTEMNIVSLEESGILPIRIRSFAEWSGKDVLAGFLDSGIDYTHPAFRNKDGTSRILRLWDQTDTRGLPPAGITYGTEYTEEDINLALLGAAAVFRPSDGSEASPLQVADRYGGTPSQNIGESEPAPLPDLRGHGTAVAGIACGSVEAGEGFTGVAPESHIAFVKLKEAKQYLRDYFRIPQNAHAFQENDLMLGIRYLTDCAASLGMPLVICLSLGSSQGGHNGHTPLEGLINATLYVPSGIEGHTSTPSPASEGHTSTPFLATEGQVSTPSSVTGNTTGSSLPGICTVAGTGNETGLDHHYFGQTHAKNGSEASVDVELLIEQETSGFTVEFWSEAPDLYALGFTSPIGETIPSIRPENGFSREFSFLLEKSRILVTWALGNESDEPDGSQVTLIRFSDPTPGTWKIHVSSLGASAGSFHMWLPVSGLIDPQIRFLSPDTNTTLVIPSCASSAITVSAWNAYDGSLYLHSGRGYTQNGHIKPDFASPGVRVTAPAANGGYAPLTGSCAASALTSGAVALLLDAGLRRDPPRHFTAEEIKQLFLQNTKKRNHEYYPNQAWGYGTMNVYGIIQL